MAGGRLCSVSYRDAFGIEHSVVVTAESLYEAGIRAIAAFRRMSMPDAQQPADATHLTIAVHAPEHQISVQQLVRWTQSCGRSPKEHALKQTLRELLDGSNGP